MLRGLEKKANICKIIKRYIYVALYLEKGDWGRLELYELANEIEHT